MVNDKNEQPTQGDELREQMRHVFNRYRRYLVGPTPSDLLYGGPDVEPFDVLVDEALAVTARQVEVRLESEAKFLRRLKLEFDANISQMAGEAWAHSDAAHMVANRLDALTHILSTEQPSKESL